MPVHLGFIGGGGIAGAHLDAAKKYGFPVTALYDINPKTAKRRQEEYHVTHVLDSAKAVAEHPEVDAVVVCTPQHVHLEGIRAACVAGKPLFTEKPLSRTLAEAYEAAWLVEKAGIVAQIGFVRRYCPEWGKFKELIEADTIGHPVVWWMAGGGRGPRSFFTIHEQGGGPMLDGMVHNYDFCRYMWGEPCRVTGSMVTLAPENTALDTGTAILEFPNGNQHTILNSWGMPDGVSSGGFHNVLGPKGIFYFGDPDNKPPEGLNLKENGYFVVKTAGGTRQVFPYKKWNMYEHQLADFVKKAEAGDRNTKATIMDGVRAQEIALAVLGEFGLEADCDCGCECK